MLDTKTIYNSISQRKGQIAILIDPDKCHSDETLAHLLKKAEFANVDYIFIGGSTVSRNDFRRVSNFIKQHSSIPLVIFPGSSQQISEQADALLYLSLISGRNPDFLIGHHVDSAMELFDMDIEVIPTSYLLIDGGTSSSVAYVSQTTPIPPENESIIMRTVKAGILQGKQLTYLDAGSGAKQIVPTSIIEKISHLGSPIIIGGGIRSHQEIKDYHKAGANVIVIGNKLEEDIDFLLDIQSFIKNRD